MDCLHFRLGRERYALALEAVGDVRAFPAVRRVPAAPRSILGVAECRGEIVAVIDLPWLLGESAGPGDANLVGLAGSGSPAALYVPAALAVSRGEPSRPAGESLGGLFQPLGVVIDGTPCLLLSPAGILAAAGS